MQKSPRALPNGVENCTEMLIHSIATSCSLQFSTRYKAKAISIKEYTNLLVFIVQLLTLQ